MDMPSYGFGRLIGQTFIVSAFGLVSGKGLLKDRVCKGGLLLTNSAVEITKVGIPFLKVPYSELHSARMTTRGKSKLIELLPLNIEAFIETIPKSVATTIKARTKSGFPAIPIFQYQLEDPLELISNELNRRIICARPTS